MSQENTLSKNNRVNSKETCEELRNIIKKAEVKVELEHEDREIIQRKSEHLSFAEKASLFRHDLIYPPGTVLFDAGGLFEAKIRIDDRHSTKSKNRPLAYIEFSD